MFCLDTEIKKHFKCKHFFEGFQLAKLVEIQIPSKYWNYSHSTSHSRLFGRTDDTNRANDPNGLNDPNRPDDPNGPDDPDGSDDLNGLDDPDRFVRRPERARQPR